MAVNASRNTTLPVVRVSALPHPPKGIVTPIAAAQQKYRTIQIGDQMFKISPVTSSEGVGAADKITRSYGNSLDGAETTMRVIAKLEKDESDDDDSLTDEASDLSLRLDDDDLKSGRITADDSRTMGIASNVTTFVQGPDGQLFVPVSYVGSGADGGMLLGSGSMIEDSTRRRELRLLKNREAAKECRRKKKDYVRCLENRVTLLENQNKTLINELKALKELYCQKSEAPC